LADDDIAILRILSKIIEKNGLGEVIGTADDGDTAVSEILRLQPDIVLIDLLMPGKDGIEAMHELAEKGCESAFIMISQVDSSKMVSRAYGAGVEFYISKPINVVEVVSVIKSIDKKQSMQKVIKTFESALLSMNIGRPSESGTGREKPKLEKCGAEDRACERRNNLKRILMQLGISGEAGYQDIIDVVLWILNRESQSGAASHSYKLSSAYDFIIDKYERESGLKLNSGAVEQRIRRTIKCAMKNLANLGIEDYYDDTFVTYSSTLFDFGEVRKEMDYERGKSNYGGKTNVKKFIEGLIIILADR